MKTKRYMSFILIAIVIMFYNFAPFRSFVKSFAAQTKPEDTYIKYCFDDKNTKGLLKNGKTIAFDFSSDAIDGKYSLEVKKRQTFDDGVGFDITKVISYNKDYSISFFAKQKTKIPQRIAVFMDFLTNNSSSRILISEKVIMPNSWTQVNGYFSSNYKDIKSAKIYVMMQSSKNESFLIDRFVIKGSNMQFVVEKEDFESKDNNWLTESKSCKIALSSEKKLDGKYAMKIDAPNYKDGTVLLPLKWLVNSKKTYNFSLCVFHNDKKSITFEMGVKVVNSKSTKYVSIAKEKIPSNRWVKLSASYFNNLDASNLYFYIKPSENIRSYYIDSLNISDEEWDKPMVELNIPSLYEKYKNYFKIGVALPYRALTNPDDVLLIKKHFNSITAENEMKPISVQPTEDGFSFVIADQYVDFCKKNNIALRGHTLVWHQQTPSWFFTNPETGELLTNSQKDKKILLDRLKKHIQTVVGRYKGKVYAWDVVNEAIDENEPDGFRKSEWFNILGTEYIEKAFIWAHEKDPQAKLYYNDYSTENPVKREFIYNLVKNLKQKGVPIDGIGLQCHISVDWPSVDEVEKTINLFSSIPGIELQITELDISIAKNLTEGDDEQKRYLLIKQAEKLRDLFEVFKRHKNVIKAVTFWGLKDDYSWLKGDYPLLFDENYQAKFSYWGIVEPSVLPNE